ncbi:hypothetical protein C8Q70DRAFT_1107990 [Cubamyces menziesii]|nr:hypothetical protein C8Q70DRAFT_1107990 [Cubamyces menziesii]
MYLIDTTTLLLHPFNKGNVPPYAILSHVWSDNEQKPRQSRFAKGQDGRKRGGLISRVVGRVRYSPSPKLLGACKKAKEDGFKWLWTDTDCIDTSNSAELSEAINSMFVWYRDAAMCYAYLHDVPPNEDPHPPQSSFRLSRWFKRTWTLQELIAPASIIFLSSDWQPIGAKRSLAELIESITGIDRLVLTHRRPLEDVSIACRMSWAASREARREEDRAYSLMGIFGVHLSTIYGEGNHAFVRLQEEILKQTSDQSIFAWGSSLHEHQSGTFVATAKEHNYEQHKDSEPLLASSPADFASCADISPMLLSEFAEKVKLPANVPIYTHTGAGIRTALPMVPLPPGQKFGACDAMLGFLGCTDTHGRLVALFLRPDPVVADKALVGGFIAQGGRYNHYYRTTRLTEADMRELFNPPPVLQDIIIQSFRHISARERSPFSTGIPSIASRNSLIFFEAPCSIHVSQASRKTLEHMGFRMPVIPNLGFRLAGPGDTRSLSFIGSHGESFTVHFGACHVDNQWGRGQLWATVSFDAGLNSMFARAASEEGSECSDAATYDSDECRDIYPDESMLVQFWRDQRQTFYSPSRQVRLAFSYSAPSDAVTERGLAEVYEMEIRLRESDYGGERRRSRGSTSSQGVSNGNASVTASR